MIHNLISQIIFQLKIAYVDDFAKNNIVRVQQYFRHVQNWIIYIYNINLKFVFLRTAKTGNIMSSQEGFHSGEYPEERQKEITTKQFAQQNYRCVLFLKLPAILNLLCNK